MSNEQSAPTLRDLDLPCASMMPGPASPMTEGQALALVSAGADDLRRSAQVGDRAALAALAMAGDAFDELGAALATRLGSGGEGGDGRPLDPAALAPALYRAAGEAFGRGEIEGAAAALGLLLPLAPARVDGLVGLAVCAGRLARDDLALDLGLEALELQPGHPRACLIAGLRHLEQGQRRAAQTYLAAASRAARKRPEFRDDLRAAQRALLLLHLA